MYTYITMILCMIFDYSKFILRFPAVICGLVTTISAYLIGFELFKSRKAAVFYWLFVYDMSCIIYVTEMGA